MNPLGLLQPGNRHAGTDHLLFILLIQRVGLKNSDGSEMRRQLQQLAVAAVKNGK